MLIINNINYNKRCLLTFLLFHLLILLNFDYSLLLSFSSTVFGYHFNRIILGQEWKNPYQILAGWLIGSLLTSYLIFTLSYFFVLSKLLVHLVIVFHFVSSFIMYSLFPLFKNQNPNQKTKNIKQESYHIYLLLAIIGSFSLFYLNKLYLKQSESNISFYTKSTERSYINSILYGINRHRNEFLSFKNPLQPNYPLKRPFIIYYYMAACELLSSNYQITSITINFLNILSTISFFFYYTRTHSSHLIILSLLYFTSSGFASFRYLFADNPNLDFVHEIERHFPLPSYQILAHILSLPKESSFSIALSFLSLSLIQFANNNCRPSILAGISAALIPYVSVSSSIFLFCSIFKKFWISMFPFSIFIVFKFLRSNLHYEPIWRRYSDEGYYFSMFLPIIEQLGLSSLGLLGIIYSDKRKSMTTLGFSISLFFSLFREDNDYYSYSIIVCTCLLPLLYCNILEFLEKENNFISKKFYGILISILLFLLCFKFIGFYNCVKVTETKSDFNISESMTEVGQFILEYVKENEIILANTTDFYPITVIGGKTTFLGSIDILLQQGEIISDSIHEYKSMIHNFDDSLLKTNKIRYILENSDHPYSCNIHYPQIFNNSQYRLYIIQ